MRIALCLLLVSSACTRKPTLEELNAHPARQLETWGGVPDTPLEERIIHPTPERILDYIRKDNIFQGYREVPRKAEVDQALLDDLRAAVRELPDAVKQLVASRLVAITTIAELGGSAYSERVNDGNDPEAAGWIIIDSSVLDRDANAWATWKENSPFIPDAKHRIEAVIEDPANDNRQNALRYILLHELGHIASFGRDIHPNWWRPPKNAKTGRFKFFRMSWRAEDQQYLSIFDETFLTRAEVAYYAPASKRLPAARAVEIYQALEKTNFPSLYGATNRQDDFAEAFVTYVHTTIDSRPFEVRLYDGDSVRKTYRACWDQPRCAEKKAFLDQLFAAAAVLPTVTFTVETGDGKDDECVAQAPDRSRVQLDQSAGVFSRIDVTLAKQQLTERAVFRDGTELEASLGGCAHFGAAYEYVVSDPTPESDEAHYLARTLELLRNTPFTEKTEWPRDILRAVEKDAKGAAECLVVIEAGYSHVFCGIARGEDGRMHLRISWDIAL